MQTKKNITGIICEYNPFHNGHILHIKKTKELTNPGVLVCVMSGNFVQRGDAAIINKWERAKVAVEHGVDLVVELPFICSTQSANMFAKGAIDILKLLQVDNIVFGSESNNLSALQKLLSIDDNISELKHLGLSSSQAYERLYGPLPANDILGLNYLKQIQNSTIKPYTIQRTNNYHDESLNGTISSASAIRKQIYENQPYAVATPMRNLNKDFELKQYYPYIKTLLLSSDSNKLSELFLMDEGIENHLIKQCKIANSYEEFIKLSTTKRYTKSSIRRTLIHLMNQTTKKQVNDLSAIDYIRVLAFNETGKQYLKSIKEEVHIASKFSQIPSPYREMELKASQVYAYPLAIDKQKALIDLELQPPIYIK